jgi:hypothetical protein
MCMSMRHVAARAVLVIERVAPFWIYQNPVNLAPFWFAVYWCEFDGFRAPHLADSVVMLVKEGITRPSSWRARKRDQT